MKLISHADDLGIRTSVNKAIEEAAALGRLSRVSCLVNYPAAHETVDFGKTYKNVKMGIHISLTAGNAVLSPAKIPTLVNDFGEFYSLTNLIRRLWFGFIDPEDIKREMNAQIDLFRDLHGSLPRHADTHHHSHFNRKIGAILRAVCEERGIPSMRTAKRYYNPAGSLQPRIINFLMWSAGYPHVANQAVPDLFLDTRFLGSTHLGQLLTELPQDALYELIWRPSSDPAEEWPYKQFVQLKDDEWWKVVKSEKIEIVN